MLIWSTEATRTMLHNRDNLYRWNDERGYWEFKDKTGPWAPSGNLSKLNKEQGEKALTEMAYTGHEEATR